MEFNNQIMSLKHFLPILALAGLLSACGKEEAPPAAMNGARSSGAAETSTNEAAASIESVMHAPAAADIMGGVESSVKALNNRDYLGASVAILKVETKELDEKSGPAYRAAMAKLQQSIAQAAANGDQKAAEAGELLRSAARH